MQVTPLQDFSYSAVNVSGIGGITTLLHFDFGLGGTCMLGAISGLLYGPVHIALNHVRTFDTWLCTGYTGP